MANLYRYAASNEKNGYFLRGLSQSSGYFNLQTVPAANRLFDQLDYEAGRLHQTEGEGVPGELTWRMYQIGLLKTNNPDSTLNNLSNDELRERFQESDAQSSLSKANLNALQSFIESYSGAGNDRVTKLSTLVESTNRDCSSTPPNTTDTEIELAEESLSQLSEWGVNVDELIETPNDYPEETSPYLDGCLSRFREYGYTPTTINLTSNGIPELWFKAEPNDLTSVKSLLWKFEDYWAQTSGRFVPIDAQLRCLMVIEWDSNEEVYTIDGVVKSGSFLEFTADPSIVDVFDSGTETDVQLPEKVYLRAINDTKQFLEETLDVFSIDVESLFT